MSDLKLLMRRIKAEYVHRYLGLKGEITASTDIGQLQIHDGVTIGGHAVGSNARVLNKPVINSPADGAAIIGSAVTIVPQPYNGPGEVYQIRVQFSLTPDFKEIVEDTGWGPVDISTLRSFLDKTTSYYVRFAYMNTFGDISPLSDVTSFRTGIH